MDRRRELIARIADFAGPIGPMRTLEDMQDARAAWLAGLDAGAIEPLLALAAEPPDAGRLAATAEEFAFELAEVLGVVGRRGPERLLAGAAPLLRAPGPGREVVVTALGTVGDPRALALLAPLARAAETLTEDEQLALACALGDLGGPAADVLLATMQPRVTSPAVTRELEIARERV